MPWVQYPDEYVNDLNLELAETEDILHQSCPDVPRNAYLEAYALAVVATATPLDRAITYLKDCRTPALAKGRLLLRAAERALRAAGELEASDDPLPKL